MTLNAVADRDVVDRGDHRERGGQDELCTASCRRSSGRDAILASNTSTISHHAHGQVGRAPENFAGMHFFNPVDRMQLVEVIRGEQDQR